MRLSRVIIFISFAGILVCLANAFMPLVLIYMTAHNTLIIKQHKEPDHIKALIGTEPLGEGGRWGSSIREHKNIILKAVIVKDLEK